MAEEMFDLSVLLKLPKLFAEHSIAIRAMQNILIANGITTKEKIEEEVAKILDALSQEMVEEAQQNLIYAAEKEFDPSEYVRM